MKKWLRWQGLVIFAVVFAGLFLLWFIFVDMILKKTIEKAGTRIVGATVELAKADLHLFPLGITLEGLQVTNPDRPMLNALEAGHIDFSLEGMNLMRRKVIIETMAVESMRFNTPRKTSGAIDRQQKETPVQVEKPNAIAIPTFTIPDVNDILKKESLSSLQQINDLRKEIDTTKNRWQRRLAEAPDQKTFEAYHERIKKLQKNVKGIAGALTSAGEIQDLRKDISRDIDLLKQIKKDFSSELSSLRKELDQLKKVPENDIRRIMEKYDLSLNGLGKVSQLLFGDKIGGTVQKTVAWYHRLKPIIEKAGALKKDDTTAKPDRSKGINVRYTEKEPLPDFLARRITISMTIPAGKISGEIRNLTPDQNILGKPLLFDFSGDGLKELQSIRINGVLDHVLPEKSRDGVKVIMKKYRVKDLVLSKEKQLPLSIREGLAFLNLDVFIQNEILDGLVKVTMDSVHMAITKKEDDSMLYQALRSTLADISAFSLTAKITGPLDGIEVKIGSDLDKVLGNAFRGQMEKAMKGFQEKLKQTITEKIKPLMANAAGDMSGLDSINQEILARLDLGDSVSTDLLKGLGGKTKLPF